MCHSSAGCDHRHREERLYSRIPHRGENGTSEKTEIQVKTGRDEYIASYCGFAPADNPQYAMLVFYDEPHGPNGYYGSPVAGPTFLKTMTEILPYLGVQPQYTGKELAKLDVKTPDVTGATLDAAKKSVNKEGLNAKIYGGGQKALSQVPEPNKPIPKDGSVVLFTDSSSASQMVTVPKLTGLSLSQANERAAGAGLNISVAGAALTGSNARSSSQDIAENSKVKPGTVVTVTFADQNQVE